LDTYPSKVMCSGSSPSILCCYPSCIESHTLGSHVCISHPRITLGKTHLLYLGGALTTSPFPPRVLTSLQCSAGSREVVLPGAPEWFSGVAVQSDISTIPHHACIVSGHHIDGAMGSMPWLHVIGLAGLSYTTVTESFHCAGILPP